MTRCTVDNHVMVQADQPNLFVGGHYDTNSVNKVLDQRARNRDPDLVRYQLNQRATNKIAYDNLRCHKNVKLQDNIITEVDSKQTSAFESLSHGSHSNSIFVVVVAKQLSKGLYITVR